MMVLDWKLSQAILALTPFDGIKWQLSNGIRSGINLAEVKKILGESLKTDRFQHFFNTDKARVEIDFYRLSSDGEKDEAYRLSGVYIRQAGAASGALRKAPVLARPLQAQIPEATQPCTAEVAKWWQEVRAAAKEAVDASRRKNQALIEAGQRRRRSIDDEDSVLSQKELDKLDADIATARETYARLLTEGQAKSHRAPIEDLPTVILYTGYPRYTEVARRNKVQGKVNMRAEFRSDGTIGDVKVVTGLGDGLDEQAIKTARQTIFLPVSYRMRIVVTFYLR
jgi:TonB family protein